MGTVSPGNSIESPQGYERTPPSYDSMYGNGYGLSQPSLSLPQGVIGDPNMLGSGQYDPSMDQSEVLWHQGHLQNPHGGPLPTPPHNPHSLPQATPPHSMPGSIPTPPNSMQSSGSPAHGKLSPMKKNYPTSPTHIQAMHQRARQERAHDSPLSRQNEQFSYQNSNVENIPVTALYTDNYGQKMSSGAHHQQPKYLEQYPTPPSQHSMESPPQIIHGAVIPDHYLTPSPDSPGQWSSSSPHSNSDWSEGISSPDQPLQNRCNKPVYI